MTKQDHLHFRKGDILAVVFVAALAVCVALCFLPRNSSAPVMAEIYQEGQLVKTVPLEEDASYVITGTYTNTVRVENGRIAIAESNCPGEDCVHSGAIAAAGRSVVCLPNAVEVRVINAQSDVDFIVG